MRFATGLNVYLFGTLLWVMSREAVLACVTISVIFLSSAFLILSMLVGVLVFPSLSTYFIFFDFYPFSLAVTTDTITLLFLFILLIVSFCIMFFSSFYMSGDLKNRWFLVVLLMFILRMVLLSLASSLFVIFIAWDGLGVTRFFLVMYYLNWDRISGAIVTVLTNRLGDYCLFWFIASLFFSGCLIYSSTFIFSSLFLILVVTRFTKRAQFPFSSWLPKAMSAPTPVRALVHRRTLVTAGLFLLMKYDMVLSSFLIMVFIFRVGLFTMLFASICALYDPDFKKVIALSTLSQLGFLMLSLGLGNVFISFFHLIRHACFKSCLFMQIGFMMHSFYRQQDRRMYNRSGAVRYVVQVQTLLCLICLSGLLFTRGFVRKDFILEFMFSSRESFFLGCLFFICVFLTMLYRLRLGLAMFKMQHNSLAYVIKSELFIYLCSPLIFASLFLLWWLNLNLFRVPFSFLYFDKLAPLCILVLFAFLAGIFHIRYYMFLPANIFYMESLVYIRKITFLNLKFLERHLLFLNNSVIMSLGTYCKRRFLYFYYYRLNILAIARILILLGIIL